jgi:predicted cupin superfamily sugar epimerase
MTRPTIDEIISTLRLAPLASEGGLFREIYRSSHVLHDDSLPAGYRGSRSLATAIYYLLTPELFSAMHRVRGDEIFHFYLGDPVDMLLLHVDGSGENVAMGVDLELGQRPQILVAGGVWQGMRLRAGGSFALLGTTMSPGFDASDFEIGGRAALSQQFPTFARAIEQLTRDV